MDYSHLKFALFGNIFQTKKNQERERNGYRRHHKSESRKRRILRYIRFCLLRSEIHQKAERCGVGFPVVIKEREIVDFIREQRGDARYQKYR